ncbi:hypothetical protein [Rubinisphaera margarita]|uniref:hypothetical protein n=1 Tax=Rubinisphaera margarita TaxID=2909586 RepID=UPI001EE82AB9|nr:hypothetical protein [Rubinisphaera margarita]MCG6157375.1 hypothetical protein [Rubinisphaera margarita]
MSDVLAECVAKLGDPPRRVALWRRPYLHVSKPAWLRQNPGDKLTTLFDHLPQVYSEGLIVWGHIIQANVLMFKPGADNCPGELVYCLDRTRHVQPKYLQELAHSLFRLKGTRPEDAELAPIADYLTDEYIRVFGLKVPRSISHSVPCRISTTYFVRKHLPQRRLCKPLMPIVVLPEKPHVAMPLPARYWPKELVTWWSE